MPTTIRAVPRATLSVLEDIIFSANNSWRTNWMRIVEPLPTIINVTKETK